VPILGFLHTSSVHVAPFDALLAELAPGWTAVHVVDESLLSDARLRGEVDAEIRGRVQARFAELVGSAPDVVICTCSTIGEVSEQLGALRVDRPMAAEAVRLAALGNGSILIVASSASTVAPTTALIDDELLRTAERTVIAAVSEGLERAHRQALLVEEAWGFFERGDMPGYANCVAEEIRAHTRSQTSDAGFAPDVIVLAQASMREVPPLLVDLDIPVLTSLALAVKAATAVATPAS
jgi:hypothetical protein